MGLPKGAGLGVEPNWEVLGKPILSVQQEMHNKSPELGKQTNNFWEGFCASKRVFGIGVETIHKVFGQSTLSVIGDYQTVRLLGVANKRHGKREILAENFQDSLNLLPGGLLVQPDQSQSLLMGERSHIILRER